MVSISRDIRSVAHSMGDDHRPSYRHNSILWSGSKNLHSPPLRITLTLCVKPSTFDLFQLKETAAQYAFGVFGPIIQDTSQNRDSVIIEQAEKIESLDCLVRALLSDEDKAAARPGIELNKPTKGAVAKDVISLVSWKG